MGLIVRGDTGLIVSLPSRCLVGRGALAQLRLSDRRVSLEHAVIYFHEKRWRVRDLGSRNGTLVSGTRVGEAQSHTLTTGDTVVFGGSANGQVWRLLTDSPPGPAASRADGAVVEAPGGTLWLPDLHFAAASVARSEGVWALSGPKGSMEVRDGDRIEVAGDAWQLHLPTGLGEQHATATTRNGGDHTLRLEFAVSFDLEHVDLTVSGGGTLVKIGARSFNQALLALASRRLDDEAEQVGPDEAGWTYAEDLRATLRLEREALNLQLWRATQAFGKAGLPGDCLIERRLDTGQLRIGLPSVIRSSKGSVRVTDAQKR